MNSGSRSAQDCQDICAARAAPGLIPPAKRLPITSSEFHAAATARHLRKSAVVGVAHNDELAFALQSLTQGAAVARVATWTTRAPSFSAISTEPSLESCRPPQLHRGYRFPEALRGLVTQIPMSETFRQGITTDISVSTDAVRTLCSARMRVEDLGGTCYSLLWFQGRFWGGIATEWRHSSCIATRRACVSQPRDGYPTCKYGLRKNLGMRPQARKRMYTNFAHMTSSTIRATVHTGTHSEPAG
jgi:hypothetical protein